VVVGAGPIGSNTAALIARKGFHVALVDRHPRDGKFTRCGNLVTPRVLGLVDAGKSVIGQVRGAEVYSPLGRRIVVDGGQTKAVVFDRARFDNQITDAAVSGGAEALFDTTAKSARRRGETLDVSLQDATSSRKVSCNILVGADGATGRISEWFGLSKPKKVLLGCEQTMAGVAGDDRFVKLFVGREFAPSFFGWIIPNGDFAKVGLCVDGGNVRAALEKMISRPHVRQFLRGARPVSYSAGGIPFGFPRRTYADNVMVVGDAACQVKATSGGGLFTGLLSSTFCAATAIEALQSRDFTGASLRSYQTAWMKALGKELRRDLAIHESYSRLTDKQFEEIFRLVDNPAILDIITKLGDIDFPSKVGWRLAREEPRLIKYAGKALRAMLPKIR